jgi:DNA-binding SARP family transcriptional activator
MLMAPETADEAVLELRLLGPFEVLVGGSVVEVGGAKPRALLACLALHLGEVVSTDKLIDQLWSEAAPETAAHAVQVYVSQLRKALGRSGGAVATRRPGYVLELSPEQVDIWSFERLAEAARFREALALWRGPALAEFEYEPFAQVAIARCDELRQLCLEGRIEADLALGRHAELVGELEALVAAEPLRERLRALLMLALYRAGRQADALATYRSARATLVEELGIEPGPELRSLEAAILHHDSSLAVPLPPTKEVAAPKRKLVTILFADIPESMTLASTLDAEAFHDLLERFSDTFQAVIERHGGTAEKFAGDAIMAVFGIPVAHEDDALRAARAALDLHEAAGGLGFETRVGIEAGEVLAGDTGTGRRFATGEAVGIAARLQETVEPGRTAVGPTAARLLAHTADLSASAPIELRGRARPLAVSSLVGLESDEPTLHRRRTVPLVGRKRELALIERVWAQSVTTASPRALLVVGPAGIGKSRLAEEFTRRVDARVLRGRCASYGEGITYAPLRSMFAPSELAAILAGPSAVDITVAFRRHCEQLARERPLVVVFDGLQWAEPTFLELVEDLVERSCGAIFVVPLAREDLLEQRPGFLDADRLHLEPLSPLDSQALLAARPLSDDTRARIVASAEGNPLFLEQLAALAAEEGGMEPTRQLPETIQALLTARLDRLGPGERDVLERAAVVGREFASAEVAALVEPVAAATVPRHLQELTSRGFLHSGVEENKFAFRHGLIQDVVYRTTPKSARAELHERLAALLAGQPGEQDELVGYHFEQATRLLAQLGAEEPTVRRLAVDAGTRLGAAGIRAWKRADVPATLNLLDRATTLLPPETALRRELLCELGIARRIDGDDDLAEETLREVVAAAAAAGDGRTALRAELELGYAQLLSHPERGASTLLELVESAIPVFEAFGDDRALSRSWLLAGFVHGGVHGRSAARETDAERSLVYYRRAGWPVSTCLGEIAAALYYGPAPVERAITRCRELLGEPTATTSGRAGVLAYLGGLLAMQGRFEEARALVAEATATYGELGQTAAAAIACGPVRGDLELLAGNAADAEVALFEACRTLERLHYRSQLATRAADLAEAVYRQARYAEAKRWAETSRACSASDDLSSEPLWRAVTAKLLARTGELGEAERLGREAVRIAGTTDALNRRARVLLDLAEVEALAGRSESAGELVAQAAALGRTKGNVALLAQARNTTAIGA